MIVDSDYYRTIRTTPIVLIIHSRLPDKGTNAIVSLSYRQNQQAKSIGLDFRLVLS